MKGKWRFIFLAFIALSLAGLFALTVRQYRGAKNLQATFTEEGGVGIRIDDVHYSNTRADRLVWELDASSATRYKKDELVVLDAVKVVFYAEDGTPYTLKAREGSFSEPTGRMEATGAVEISSGAGYRLETESISYMADTRQITTDEPVRMTSGGMEVEGVGLRVDIDGGRFYLLREVRALLSDNSL
ncbi:MAG TPA: LPS export ABC transporter periplasmic protein LptC [Thermodesulfobacteriota bacterium]|nr:LPS export ABC transporter periplasmic protein LptC [Thermodesulfobacteriota bacterium]